MGKFLQELRQRLLILAEPRFSFLKLRELIGGITRLLVGLPRGRAQSQDEGDEQAGRDQQPEQERDQSRHDAPFAVFRRVRFAAARKGSPRARTHGRAPNSTSWDVRVHEVQVGAVTAVVLPMAKKRIISGLPLPSGVSMDTSGRPLLP